MRYSDKQKFKLTNEIYQDWYETYGVDFFELYDVSPLTYPSNRDLKNLDVQPYTWKEGDSLFRLSHQFYNSYKHWEIIAVFNLKPTDALYRPGDIIYIPHPLELVKQIMKM